MVQGITEERYKWILSMLYFTARCALMTNVYTIKCISLYKPSGLCEFVHIVHIIAYKFIIHLPILLEFQIKQSHFYIRSLVFGWMAASST